MNTKKKSIMDSRGMGCRWKTLKLRDGICQDLCDTSYIAKSSINIFIEFIQTCYDN